MNSQPFIPTWKWHLKVLIVLGFLCTTAFFVLSWAQHKLPLSYRTQTANAQTTPWLNAEDTYEIK